LRELNARTAGASVKASRKAAESKGNSVARLEIVDDRS
jgi:hypothetical protein